jgi:hypothetical protein
MKFKDREWWRELFRSRVVFVVPAAGIYCVVWGLCGLIAVFVLRTPEQLDSWAAVIDFILGALLIASSIWIDKGEAQFGVGCGLFAGGLMCGALSFFGLGAMALTQVKRWEWLGLAVLFFTFGALQILASNRVFKDWARGREISAFKSPKRASDRSLRERVE